MERRYLCTDVAAMYGVAITTVYDWIKAKRLPALKIGKKYYITPDGLQEFERKANEENRNAINK